ncbi:hypothetical protein FWG86_01415 [Candidatus Saccharibacteria bacterium]|nr:hypothetical protein [Candidatus Saccharibacteria bacterium]
MNRLARLLMVLLVAVAGVVAVPATVSGSGYDCEQGAIIQVSCDDEGGGIFGVLNLVLNVLTVGVGIAATAGVIFAALRYTQARDNTESAAGAKRMIINILIGLAAWAVFWTLLQWLLPGGIF